MQPNELAIIEQLTGVDQAKIQFSDNGFWSRGYIIDGGRIVFKFKKTPDFSYQSEIDALNYINTLDLGVLHQRVGWISPDDSYLGLHGVVGEPLVVASKNKPELNALYDLDSIAQQLAEALTKLHRAQPEHPAIVSLEEEIATWQERIFDQHNWQTLAGFLTQAELTLVENFCRQTLPATLRALGATPVLTHGDLYKNNLFLNQQGKVGIIDFYRLQLLDEAADFMDISNDILREKILDYYGADPVLRQKVQLRASLRPIYLFGAFVSHPGQTTGKSDQNQKQLSGFAQRARRLIQQGYYS